MDMFLCCEWTGADRVVEVTNPYDGSVLDTVPRGRPEDIERAVGGLVDGAERMRKLTAYERSRILRRAAELMRQRQEELAKLISMEEGKVLAEARVETARACDVLDLCADEARRLYGEVVPLDASPGVSGRIGFTMRVPCGVVAAISPFNFPLMLVLHKVGPAIAAGNAVLMKPASDTPLSALKLTELLLEAGLPPEAIACVPGPGSELGEAICTDKRIRKVSFTGSYEVGNKICQKAGMKRVTMELGGNSPVIVADDADIERAASAVALGGYANAGQVCISVQRLLVAERVRTEFLEALKERVSRLTTGNQLDESTRVGPMIREAEAKRVEAWINEAIEAGARLVIGGRRHGTIYEPTILDEVDPKLKVSCEELFGPAVAITYFKEFDEAIRLANDSRYGLSAGIFTADLERAMRFAQEVHSGNLHVNWSSQWRADLMPYGGLKDSGLGKEGPRYTIREMTEEKMVVLHLKS